MSSTNKDILFLKRHKTETECFAMNNEKAMETKKESRLTTRAKSEDILDSNTTKDNTLEKYKSLNDMPPGVDTDNREKQSGKQKSANSSSTKELTHTIMPERLPEIFESKRTKTKADASGCWNLMPVTSCGRRGGDHATDHHFNATWDQRPESPNEYVDDSEEEESLSTSREAFSQNELFRPSTNNISHTDMTLNTSFTQQIDKEGDTPFLAEMRGDDHILKELEALRWHGVADADYSSTIELNSTSLEQPGLPFEKPYSRDRPSSEGQICSTPIHKTNDSRPKSMALHPYAFDLSGENEEPASVSSKCQEKKRSLAELCSKTNLAKVPKKVGLSKKAKVEKLHNYIKPK